MAACGGAPPPAPEPPREIDVRTALPEGASLVVLARPRELFESEASALVLHALLPDAQLEAIRVHDGIDLRTVERIAVATYDVGDAAGTLVVLQGPFRAEVAVAEIAHRMVPRESVTEGEHARAGGVLHGTRMDALAVDAHTLALAIGPPQLAGRMTRTLEGGAPPAIAGAVQQALARHIGPLVAIRPIPLGLPLDEPVGLLLAEEQSLTVGVTPAGASAVHLEVDLAGEFPPHADENFRRLVASMAHTSLGTAIGLRSGLGTLHVEASPTFVSLSADFDAHELARGLSLLFRAEIAEVLEDPAWTDLHADPSSTRN